MAVFDFKYSGIPQKLDRTIGNASYQKFDAKNADAAFDIKSYLLKTLRTINAILDKAIFDIRATLNETSVLVSPNTEIAIAHEKTWPKDKLGPIKGYITFDEYLYNVNKIGSAPQVIVGYYEKYVRQSPYARRLDLFKFSNTLRLESGRILTFVESYIKDTNDTSEKKVLQLLQGWANDGLKYADTVRKLLREEESGERQAFSPAELDKVTKDEARKTQAILQARVNGLNTTIRMDQEFLDKSFTNLSDVFYNKFLGPALSFKNTAISGLDKKLDARVNEPGLIGQIAEAGQTAGMTLQVNIADQMIRNQNFSRRSLNLLNNMVSRDTYIVGIQELQASGAQPPTTRLTSDGLTQAEYDYFANPDEAIEDVFRASHEFLDDLESPTAHPQYILRSGDTIDGHILLGADATIDGIRPSSHSHKGVDVDGSEKISARDLLEGSLLTNLVDTSEEVAQPSNLQIVSNTNVSTASTSLVDVAFQWVGDPNSTYEIQLTPYSEIDAEELYPSFSIDAESADLIFESPRGLWGLFNSAYGDEWHFFLVPDADRNGVSEFKSDGLHAGQTSQEIRYAIATESNDNRLIYHSFGHNDFSFDQTFKIPTYRSNSWIHRKDGSSLAAAGNKLFKITAGDTVELKNFNSDTKKNQAVQVYSISIDPISQTSYVFVKRKEYRNDINKPELSQVEFYQIDSDDNVTVLKQWLNQKQIDKVVNDDGETRYGWLSSYINEKDFPLINSGFVYEQKIYGFCLNAISRADLPTLSNEITGSTVIMPTLCSFDLKTLKKEIIKTKDDSYIISSDFINYASPQPVIKDGKLYLAGYTALATKEAISATVRTNSYISFDLSSKEFVRHFVKLNQIANAYIVGVAIDLNNSLYAVGFNALVTVPNEQKYGGIFSLD